MSDFVSLDFGVRDGKPVTLTELPLSDYGLKCGLTCAECDKPLEAVRRNQNKPEEGWWYLRHHGDEDNSCPGYGDKSCHLLAEHLLRKSIGKTMRLPAIGVRDSTPHISRYTDTGILRQHQTDEPIDTETTDEWGVWDEKTGLPNLIVRKPVDAIILRVEEEQRLTEGVIIPDLLVTVSIDGEERTFAYEVRYAHAKTLADVNKYRRLGMPVIECLVKDIDVHDMQVEALLLDRLLGKTGYMEWLYHPQTVALADRRYRLTWACEPYELVRAKHLAAMDDMREWSDCRSGKPVAHLMTGVILDNWGMSVDLGLVNGPAGTSGSIYGLRRLRDTLLKIDRKGAPNLSDEEWEKAARLDEQRGSVNMSGAHVLKAECWACRKPFVYWLMDESVKYPQPWRMEERPQVVWQAMRVARESYPNIPLAVFKTHQAKTEKDKPYRAFACPSCGRIQRDKELFEWFQNQLDIETANRIAAEQAKYEERLRQRLKETMARAWLKQLRQRTTGLREQADDTFEWLDEHAGAHLSSEAGTEWREAQDACHLMFAKLEEAFKRLDPTKWEEPSQSKDGKSEAAESDESGKPDKDKAKPDTGSDKPAERPRVQPKHLDPDDDPWNRPITTVPDTLEKPDHDPWRNVPQTDISDDPWCREPTQTTQQHDKEVTHERQEAKDPWLVRSAGTRALG